MEQEETEGAYRRNYLFPEREAETIAKHYVAHALLAQQILKLVEMGKQGPQTEELNLLIKRLVRDIKQNHLHDFGIPLEWRQPWINPV